MLNVRSIPTNQSFHSFSQSSNIIDEIRHNAREIFDLRELNSNSRIFTSFINLFRYWNESNLLRVLVESQKAKEHITSNKFYFDAYINFNFN